MEQDGTRSPPSTEDRILEAARAVMVKRGTAGARMQEIADEAGVNAALLHYYFGSKRRLADAVLRTVAWPLVVRFLGAWSPSDSLEENVRRAVAVCVDEMDRDPAVMGYILAEAHRNPDRLARVRAELEGAAAESAPGLVEWLGPRLRQRAAARGVEPVAPEEFLLDLVGLAVFPYLVRPALLAVPGLDEAAVERLLVERARGVPVLLLGAPAAAGAAPTERLSPRPEWPAATSLGRPRSRPGSSPPPGAGRRPS